ncbi:hypothetical protein ID866_2555 [Astraeus odoratus]|nr:hypothetical protein ID866_2555 [Astraeus odoratus]
MAPARPSRIVYRINSASQSATSLSENDDEYPSKSAFFSRDDDPLRSSSQWALSYENVPPARPYITHLPPEILIHILRHLHSPRDLYHCMLVSRMWCQCAVELLWHRPAFTRLSTLVKLITILSRPDQTFTYARFIKRLNFLFLGSDLTDVLFCRLAQCDRLERLTLVNCSAVSEDALVRVLTRLPNLIAIDLTGVTETTDKVILGLASVSRRLQGINLTGCKHVTDIGLFGLARECPLLRRVKLSGVEQVTDSSVSAVAKACPLLLEIDLNNCKRITNASVRDLWIHCTHMREMRLSYCSDLTDIAFPAPIRNRETALGLVTPRPWDDLPPLILPRTLDHLRMLDLTGCSLITDDAVEGIISHAPKIRNLVLSKCSLLTDKAVESVCLLGKHLHYLHLGHATHITDRSIKSLARCCTRLRYVDFANCSLLTDMSVFELASLPKLRRIGLVRVSNLTDEAIYALAERHSTLERIHLSYCDQISVMAIHFLLQKLHKLTHLSLTGIPSFRKPELQQFCRQPPQEFNMTQRMSFCVYSGTGVAKLRSFLTDLFNTITEDMQGDDEETEYDDDFDESFVEVPHDADVEMENEGDIDDDFMHDGRFHFQPSVHRGLPSRDLLVEPMVTPRHSSAAVQHSPIQSSSSVAPPPTGPSASRFITAEYNPFNTHSNVESSSGPQRRQGGFGLHPVVETSPSPAPSDVASNPSAGTAQSNGAGFFRTYQDVALSSRSNGALTPDYDYAEIGHGRGASNFFGSSLPTFGNHAFTSATIGSGATQGITQATHSAVASMEPRHRQGQPQSSSLAMPDNPIPWPRQEPPTPTAAPSGSSSENSPPFNASSDPREPDGRGRSVRRSLRNTFNAAEHYATSFLFGRSSGSSGSHEAGSSNGMKG